MATSTTERGDIDSPDRLLAEYPVMLFDGLCSFCNGAAKFVIRHEKAECIRFAALQSKTGELYRIKFGFPADKIDTFMIIRNGRCYSHFQAVLELGDLMGGGWARTSRILRAIVPDFLGKIIYKLLWPMRKIFGSKQQCEIPATSVRHRFIDNAVVQSM